MKLENHHFKESESNYAWAVNFILPKIKNSPIKRVAEIGSRDALDAIWLSEIFQCDVDVFEPDPLNVKTCEKNISELSSDRVKLHSFCLTKETGSIDFYSVDVDRYDNRGSSSLHPINFSRRPRSDPDRNRKSVQTKISVGGFRFEDLHVEVPDLIAMDVEGAELKVLQGFGAQIKRVKFIIAESSYWNSHKSNRFATFPFLHNFLLINGFKFLASNHEGLSRFPRPAIRKSILNMHQPNFDVVYYNKSF